MNGKIPKKTVEGYQQMKKTEQGKRNRLEDFDVEGYLKSIYKEGTAVEEEKSEDLFSFFTLHQNLILKILIGLCYGAIFGVLLAHFF